MPIINIMQDVLFFNSLGKELISEYVVFLWLEKHYYYLSYLIHIVWFFYFLSLTIPSPVV